jgi:replication initiation protein RepC
MYAELVGRIPRSPTASDVANVLDGMELLREEILNQLDMQPIRGFNGINAAHNEQHIQNSKPESLNEIEPRSRQEQGAQPSKFGQPKSEGLKAFPLGVVLKACPQIADYGSGGAVASWRDLMSAAVVVRSMLGVSPSAYQDACEVMGPENAAVAVACILERANLINSAGGYLRDLTRRTERGEFSLGPVIMALLRGNGEKVPQAG